MDGLAATLRDCVRRALAEDLGATRLDPDCDLTSRLAVPAGLSGCARLVAKSTGVLAGSQCALQVFRELVPDCRFDLLRQDGETFAPGDLILRVVGDMRGLLAAERTALNFVQRLSGIATATRAFVAAVAGTGARVLDTRKTTPGLRLLEKAAVLAGGGCNHRMGLYDQVLLKENHFAFARPASYEEVVRRCVQAAAVPVTAEARDVGEALAAVRGGAAVVLLDNFTPGAGLRAAVAAVRSAAAALGRTVEVEASGGVDLRSVRDFAECGVDRISIGALTHSAPAVDLSLLVEGVEG
ncbi:MAG: carboxylating nicotinate-nucleotide diphosphorylase [Planctomycetes bacterium]|nr:carboxylating nicotinate-nucleotide diphosphorylase [Planctomycetota bacterium]